MAGFGRRMRAALLGTIPGPTYYAALSVGDPGDAGATLNEPAVGNGYSRIPLQWDPAVSTPISGSPAILYCWFTLIWTSTGPWTVSLTQPVSHVAIFTAAAGTDESTFVGSVPLLPPRLMDRAGIQLRIPAYDLQLSIGLED